MNDNNPSADPFGQIADEFVETIRQGKRPSVEEFARRYPAHADDIRDMLPALLLVEQAKTTDGSLEQPRTDQDSAAAPALKQLGDYEILREVGRGGMGVVYEAQQLSLGRHVAIKVLAAHARLDARQLVRFQREARSAAKLHHTNIVPVFGVGEQDRLHYYVMQFIQGLGLDVVLAELRRLRKPRTKHAPTQGDAAGRRTNLARDVSAASVAHALLTGEFRASEPAPALTTAPGEPAAEIPASSSVRATDTSATIHLPGQSGGSTLSESSNQYWQSVARVGIQVADALAHAAGQGVLHRDIKPSNLLLDDTGNVWVTDFGLAKAVSDSDNLTQTGDIVGTIRYMAPERFDGHGDLRSDTYSLGLTLYEMLVLRPAFNEADRNKLVKEVMHGEPVRPRKLNPSVPRDLETVVLKAIARDPAHRYQTPGEMAEDLKRFVEDRPVRARRISTAEQFWRWCHRNPLPASLLAGIVLMFLTGFIGVSWQWRLTETARQDEKDQRGRAEALRQAAETARDEAKQSAKQAEQSQQETEKALAIVESQKTKAEAAERLARAAVEEGRQLQYTTDMQLAPFVWKDDRSTAEQLRILLANHFPDSKVNVGRASQPVRQEDGLGSPSHIAKPDLRGFEWHYYQHLLEHSAAVFSGHAVSVVAGAFTADGQLLTLDQNGQVRRWDLGSQAEDIASRRDLPGGAGAQVRVLSPNGRLAALAEGNKVRVFDTSTGKPMFALDSADSNPYRRLIFSRDSKRLVIVDNRIRWCNAVSGEVISSVNHKFQEVSFWGSLALSADGRTLAVVGYGPHDLGNLFSIFRLDTAARIATPLAKDVVHRSTLTASALSPNGQRIAVGASLSGSLSVFDTTTGRLLARHEAAHASPIRAMAFTDDGAKLATADAAGTIKIWADVQKLTSKSVALLTLKGHQGLIQTVGFSSDGKRLVSVSADKTARVWDLENASASIRPLERSGVYCFVVRFSADGKWIAAAEGSSLRLWDAATGRLVRELSACDKNGIQSLAFSPTDNRLLAVGYGGQADVSYVALWDIDAGTELARLPGATDLPDLRANEYTGAVAALAFSPNGKYLVAGFGSKRLFTTESSLHPLKVWEVATRRLIRRLNGHTGYCISLDFSGDGTLLASGSRDGTAILWSTATWEATQTLQNPDRGTNPDDNQAGRRFVDDAAFSPDGKTLAMASRAGNVHLWNVADGKLLATLKGHSSAVQAVAFSPDGRTLASGSADQTVRLWNVRTRRQLMQLDAGSVELGQVRTLAFSPDGKQLLAGGSRTAFWSAAPAAAAKMKP